MCAITVLIEGEASVIAARNALQKDVTVKDRTSRRRYPRRLLMAGADSATGCILAAALIVVLARPSAGERIAAATVRPAIPVYNAYLGQSGTSAQRGDRDFRGYSKVSREVISAVPGILAIDPGHRDVNGNGCIEPANEMWRNYVGAASLGLYYTIKNVILVKERPSEVQCSEVFVDTPITQHGTPNIRTWWPLLFEAPGTTWKLTLLYGTCKAWDDDGSGPNKPAYAHCEVWQWKLDADLSSLKRTLDVFHEMPFGLSGTPLVSDEALFYQLQGYVALAQACLNFGDTTGAGMALGDFELAAADRCIAATPLAPAVGGYGTGIAQSAESPACCKLLIDVEYIAKKFGVFQTAK